MQLPKLTPLQSRLLASVIATCLLIVIWIAFQPHHFVYAAELQVTRAEISDDTFYPPIQDEKEIKLKEKDGDWTGDHEHEHASYEPQFQYFERSILGRAPEGVDILKNNEKKIMESNPGDTYYFVFSKQDMGSANQQRESIELKKREPDDEEQKMNESRAASNSLRDGEDPSEEVEQKPQTQKRQDGKQVYISVTTCRQPMANGTTTGDPPQLSLYISTDAVNQKPGPSATNNLAIDPIPFVGGLAQANFQASSDVFIGISAPNVDQNWAGSYRYEVTASVDDYYHSSSNDAFLFLVDRDSDSTLFITPPLTNNDSSPEQNNTWMTRPTPFTMYAFTQEDTTMNGLERSLCGLQEMFQNGTKTSIKVEAGMNDKFAGDGPKAQFYLQGLNKSTTYNGFLAINGNLTGADGLSFPNLGSQKPIRGGGRIFKQFDWTTKANENCQIIYNLTFCTNTAYAVPANPSKFNDSELAKFYDDQARTHYRNFTNSLAQVACNTTSTAQYSLARNCTDCANDYKDWLCSVLVPRCEDFNNPDSFLVERNIGQPFFNGSKAYSNSTEAFKVNKGMRLAFNSSRNPTIDEKIQPGPYKEILPCNDLCYGLVRSCPAKLGFSCPDGWGMKVSYGERSGDLRNLTCNFPGAVKDLNEFRGTAERILPSLGLLIWISAITGLTYWI